MRRFAVVLNLVSVVTMVFAATMLLPLAVSLVLGDRGELAHAEAIYFTTLSGALLWMLTRHGARELRTRDGFLFVTLVWTVLPAFATLPLLIYLPGLSFTEAYFEAMSGMTATGATVLSGLDDLPPSLNLWRAQLQWLGGMGVIVLAVAVLPLLGVGGRQVLKAETPGPMKEKQLTPRIAQTAKGLWYVYSLMTLLCGAGYVLAGMSWIDALTHAFSTVSLGGFSSHDASFAHFNSPAVELVAIVFMLVAGMNFGTHFLAMRGVSLRPYAVDPELRAYLAVVCAGVLVVAGYLLIGAVYAEPGVALRRAAFNVISVATTTGYATTDYAVWPLFAPLLMRHQDDARAAHVPAGVPRARAHGSSARPDPGKARRTGGRQPDHLCRARLHAGLRGDDDRDHHAADGDRIGFRDRVFGQHRHGQQPRPRPGQRRPGRQLCGLRPFPDVDMHCRDAARQAGTDHRVRPVHAGVLAQMNAQPVRFAFFTRCGLFLP
jgi:hypothetical protein